MVYVTVKQPPMCHQMTLEEFLFGTTATTYVINYNETNTRTYERTILSKRFVGSVDISQLIDKLTQFNASVETLRNTPRKELYREFFIPKKSRGFRKIDAPEPELMEALRLLKSILEQDFGALYHTSAFAYIRHRSTIDAVKKHQANESKWFGKYDLSNFFGSTTLDFVMKMFSIVFPFSEVVKNNAGKEELRKALELAFLDGGLPQGTPISPLITNVMMIPIDFKLANGFRDFNNQSFVYTRYADDFLISSRYTFDFREVENFIATTLANFDAPFTVNHTKTRYGSSAGSNWNLGVMLNGNNQITIGYKKKRQFQAMLSSYVMDKKNGIEWDLYDVQVLDGHRNYYRMVEGENIDNLVKHIGEKFGVDIVQLIKADLKK